MIVTGFYILARRAYSETDGPPGEVAIGSALEQLGYDVAYVTDCYSPRRAGPYRASRTRDH